MSIRIVGFGGEPACGKSTLMREVMRLLGMTGRAALRKFGRGLATTVYPDAKVLVLGTYDEGQAFGGTDRLSMSVQPEAEAFLVMAQSSPAWEGWTLAFEGDRLFNGKFLATALKCGAECRFFLLEAPEEVLRNRHTWRGDAQDERWLKGRRSKVRRLREEFGLPVFSHAAPEDTGALAGRVLAFDFPPLEPAHDLFSTQEVRNGRGITASAD